MPAKGSTIPIALRFWTHVRKTATCWLWLGSKVHFGHGRIEVNGKQAMAHVIAYELLVGPIPPGMCILHNCPGGDNPACVNPAHLWLGTKGDNNRDRAAKGRSVGPVGSRSSHTHLTEGDVQAIRAAYAAGGVTYRQLGERYGVTVSGISGIINRYNWRHVA